jgi:hypothetical protein
MAISNTYQYRELKDSIITYIQSGNTYLYIRQIKVDDSNKYLTIYDYNGFNRQLI